MNFVKIAKQLHEDASPIFCDKGVFKIHVDIYLQRKDEFQILIQCLVDFMHLSVLNFIEKYIQGSGIEGSLQQTKVFGVDVVDTVLYGINIKQFFKGYLILANTIEKWNAFLKIADINQFDGFSDAIKSLQIALASKHFEGSKLSHETCSSKCELIKQEFEKFSNICF